MYLFPEWSQIKPIQSKYQFIFWECWFEKKKRVGNVFYWKFHSLTSAAPSPPSEMKYDFMFSRSLSHQSSFGVSLLAKVQLACVLLTDLKAVKWTGWLTGWDSKLNRASPDIWPCWYQLRPSARGRSDSLGRAITDSLAPPFTYIFL